MIEAQIMATFGRKPIMLETISSSPSMRDLLIRNLLMTKTLNLIGRCPVGFGGRSQMICHECNSEDHNNI
jgi:hypothetical protein